MLKQILNTKYLLCAMKNGANRIIKERTPRFIAGATLLMLLLVWLLMGKLVQSNALAGMMVALYRMALIAIIICGGTFALWTLGNPKDFLKIQFAITRVSGLTNAVGEYPVLISRTPEKGGEVWEFESYGIPLSMFNDAAEKIENALNVALISADTGSDGRKILLTVVPNPCPWPSVLPWKSSKMPKGDSVIALGENRGTQVTTDFSVTPHLSICGQTGSGKTVLTKMIMLQFLLKDWIVYLIDYKRGVDYGSEWKRRCTFVTDDEALLDLLHDVLEEMLERFRILEKIDCSNIEVYNSNSADGLMFPHIAVCFDEAAEALEISAGMSKEEKERKSEIASALNSIARLGRAAGIHLLITTQRTSAEVFKGQLRSNLQVICGIANENLSLLALNSGDANKRLPKTARGRFIREDGTMFQSYYSNFEETDFNK